MSNVRQDNILVKIWVEAVWPSWRQASYTALLKQRLRQATSQKIPNIQADLRTRRNSTKSTAISSALLLLSASVLNEHGQKKCLIEQPENAVASFWTSDRHLTSCSQVPVFDWPGADRTGERTTWNFNKISSSNRPVERPRKLRPSSRAYTVICNGSLFNYCSVIVVPSS